VGWRVSPQEDPDWGYARNKLFILKTSSAEYSASVYTAPLDTPYGRFYGPNRDYSWQGLLFGPHGGRVYKLLDAVYFLPDRLEELEAVDVAIESSACVYTYRGPGGELLSVYHSLTQDELGVRLKVDVGEPCIFTVLFDSRDAESWSESEYTVRVHGGVVEVRPSETPVGVELAGFDRLELVDFEVDWVYKLGNGFRKVEGGIVKFVGHRRRLRAPMLLHSRRGTLTVCVPTPRRLPELPEAKPEIPGEGPIAEALRMRLENLARFSILWDGVWTPEAGSWWFRRPWTRDVLEGVRWNLKAYVEALGWVSRVRELLAGTLRIARELQGLPIILGSKTPLSSDSLPQLIYTASKFSRMTSDRELMKAVCRLAEEVSRRLMRGLEFSATRLVEGVLCSPANSSWIDTVVEVSGKRWPLRLPLEWTGKLEEPLEAPFALVEVNALYIEALRHLLVSSVRLGVRCGGEVIQLLETLVGGFRRWFIRDGLPPITLSPELRLVDDTAGSPSVQAVSMLLEVVYDVDSARRCWEAVSERLLVYRRLVELGHGVEPFGVLVRDVERRPYLGDMEYHGPTVWPRDTPYLMRLMEYLGMDVVGVLLNNLDHMVSEGAVGYCSELFSLPVGGNPSPGVWSSNPVPVKNPAQYWSHWCDPYLEHLEEVVHACSH